VLLALFDATPVPPFPSRPKKKKESIQEFELTFEPPAATACPAQRRGAQHAVHDSILRASPSSPSSPLPRPPTLWSERLCPGEGQCVQNALHPAVPVPGFLGSPITRGEPEAVIPSTNNPHNQLAACPSALSVVPHEAPTDAAGHPASREPAVARSHVGRSEEHGDGGQRAPITTSHHRRPRDAERGHHVSARLG
jgi:hypothetical protein